MRYSKNLRAVMAALVAAAAVIAAIWTLAVFGGQVRAQYSALGFIACALSGGGVAGALLGPYLGLPGWRGTLLSLGTFLAATVIGAAIAGLLGMRIERAIDLVSLWLAMHFLTPGFFFWAGLWGAVHLSARALRQRFT